MNNIAEKISEFFDKYNLKNYRGTVLVAFSGGYDSMCLLDVLIKLGLNPVAIHLNHNWRGDESDKEEMRCKEFCKENDIKLYCEKLDENIPKTETAARNARYKFFEKCAKRFDSKVIFTAHNANDNAETVLYRIIKGTAVNGLAGIAPVRGIFYRPLLNISRKEIEDYCKTNKLNPNNDSSNNNTKYNRNYLRHKIFPLIKKINPCVINAINSLSDIAKDDCEILEDLTKNIISSTEKFTSSALPIQRRYIKNKLIEYNLDYDRSKIELILDFILQNSSSKSGKTMSLSSEYELYVNSKNIKVIPLSKHKNKNQISITQEGFYEFGSKIFSILPCKTIPDNFPSDSNSVAYVSISNINFTLRTRRDGDVFSPLGLSGHQKLKKFLNEKKIPNYKKDTLLFLFSGNEVIWAPGLGLSDKVKVKDNVTHILKLEERADYESN